MLGALLAGIGVATGAFGAHGLKSMVTADRLAVFETAVRYQMYHAFAILFVGMLMQSRSGLDLSLAGWLFLAGIVLFSGSLYVLVLADMRSLGMITPLGGVAFIAGWLVLAWRVWRA